MLAALLTAWSFVVVSYDSSPEQVSLYQLTPLVDVVNRAGQTFAAEAYPSFAYSCLGMCVVLLLVGIQTASRATNYLTFSVIFALVGQLLLIDQRLVATLLSYVGMVPAPLAVKKGCIALGLSGYILSALCFVRASRGNALDGALGARAERDYTFTIKDLTLLVAVFSAAVVLRLYALNHILNYFEGEISPYSAGATSLRGMWFANEGYHGPWSPLGILYYLPIYATTALFGTNLLSLRLASVVVSLLTIPILFIFTRRLAGKFAAHIAVILFTLNFLHIGWARSDIYPHGATTWPTLVLCYAFLRAYDTKSLLWSAAVAFLMGLTWHQYPSGQSAVVAPVIALVLNFMFNRKARDFSWGQRFVVMCGVALWAIGAPLTRYLTDGLIKITNIFNTQGNRTLWGGNEGDPGGLGTIWFVIASAASHSWDVFQSFFFRAIHIFHQEWIPNQPGINSRVAGWAVVAFGTIGMFILLRYRRKVESNIMFGWIIAAVLPGILSAVPYPKRTATLFTAIDILAAVGLSAIFHLVVAHGRSWRRYVSLTTIGVVFLGFFAFTSNAFFTKKQFSIGEPPENQVAADIRLMITPGTIVVTELSRGYDAGKFLYLLVDHLSDPKNRPNVFFQAGQADARRMVTDPRLAARLIRNRLAYVWTKMRDQMEETEQNTEWSRVLYIIQDGRPQEYPNDDLIQAVLASCQKPTVTKIPAHGSVINSLTIVQCDLKDAVVGEAAPPVE